MGFDQLYNLINSAITDENYDYDKKKIVISEIINYYGRISFFKQSPSCSYVLSKMFKGSVGGYIGLSFTVTVDSLISTFPVHFLDLRKRRQYNRNM